MLTPLDGPEWPLTAEATFRIALWLTQEDRLKLRGGYQPPGLAFAAGQWDGDIDEPMMPDAGAGAGAQHDEGFDDVNMNQPPLLPAANVELE